MSDSKILEKLRKLIAHEKSARSIGSLIEAEAFAAKIQELMDEHKVGMTEVEFAEREASEPINFSAYVGPEGWKGGPGRRQYWTMTLARAIATTNECKVVCGHGNRFCFVGRTSNREYCVMLFSYMFELGDELCAKAARENRDEQYTILIQERSYYCESERRNAFRHWMKDYNKSWKAGFADAIRDRLYALQTKRDKAATKTGAIVHIKRDAIALKDFWAKQEGFHKVNTNTRAVSGDGYTSGKRTGNSVNLPPHRLKPNRRSTAGLLGAGQ